LTQVDSAVAAAAVPALPATQRVQLSGPDKRDNVVYWKTKRKINDDQCLVRANIAGVAAGAVDSSVALIAPAGSSNTASNG